MTKKLPSVFKQLESIHTKSEESKNSITYEKACEVFEKIYPSAKKCMISEAVYYTKQTKIKKTSVLQKPNETNLRPILNSINEISSRATDYNYKSKMIASHFYRWLADKEPEFLLPIPKWDGIDRLKLITDCIKIQNSVFTPEQVENVFKYWVSNALRRALDPMVQNPCLILYGAQGIGKDTLINNLFKYFDIYYSSVSLNVSNKNDIYMNLESSIFAYIPEQDDMSKTELSLMKDLITGRDHKLRKPYARTSEKMLQTWSFISSSNFDDMLKDPSGNRRFYILPVESIDYSYVKYVDGPQIASQIVALYNANYELTVDTSKSFELVRKDFEPEDKLTLCVDGIIQSIAKEYANTEYNRNEANELIAPLSNFSKIISSNISMYKGVKANAVYKRLRAVDITFRHEVKHRAFVRVHKCLQIMHDLEHDLNNAERQSTLYNHTLQH